MYHHQHTSLRSKFRLACGSEHGVLTLLVRLVAIRQIGLLLLILGSLAVIGVQAHPADEFCDQGGMDPLLCAELAELDRSAAKTSTLPQINLDRSPLDTFTLYTKLGVDHILPLGLDHLAFVLALILSASALKTVLIQISLFTVAHSVTLALGVLGLVQLNSLWVEVAIALSIAFVAIENLLFEIRLKWRSLIVFGFGLLHGLGFAGALSELGVPSNHFFSALIGFNIGVEIGQLAFGLACFVLLHKLIEKHNFRRFVFVPGNCLIALAGLYWLFERLA